MLYQLSYASISAEGPEAILNLNRSAFRVNGLDSQTQTATRLSVWQYDRDRLAQRLWKQRIECAGIPTEVRNDRPCQQMNRPIGAGNRLTARAKLCIKRCQRSAAKIVWLVE